MASSPFTTYSNIGLSDGTNISYVEAGSPSNPTFLLLHGFPSSNNQFRNLIPLLAPFYHVIAPDLPGFGLTTSPKDYAFTFANFALSIQAFLDALDVKTYAVYIFDYGAPTALRIALKKPHSVKAIVSQNGNAYVEGFGHPFWDPIEALWKDNSPHNRDFLRDNYLTLAGTKSQYTIGFPASDLPLVDPVTYNYDYLQNLEGKENQERQLDIFYDYRTNLDVYPKIQEYFRETQVPLLAVWGKGDPIFVPPGAKAFKKDLPHAKVELIDAGHFALETKAEEIAKKILHFFKEIHFGL